LARERELAFYWVEEEGIPARELYTKEKAEEAIFDADHVLRLVENLLISR